MTKKELVKLMLNTELTSDMKEIIFAYEELLQEKERVIEEIALSKNRGWGGNRGKKKANLDTLEECLEYQVTWLNWADDVNNKTLKELYELSPKNFKYVKEKAQNEKVRKAAIMVEEHLNKQAKALIGEEKANKLTKAITSRCGEEANKELKKWKYEFLVSNLAEITELQAVRIREGIEKKTA